MKPVVTVTVLVLAIASTGCGLCFIPSGCGGDVGDFHDDAGESDASADAPQEANEDAADAHADADAEDAGDGGENG